MPQQEKITRKLDLRNSAVFAGRKGQLVTANLSVTNAYAGQMIVANNSSQVIYFNLPVTNGANGDTYYFLQGNTATNSSKMQIVGDTNTIITHLGAIKAVNYGLLGQNLGHGCMIWGDGTNWYLFNMGPAAATANTFLQG